MGSPHRTSRLLPWVPPVVMILAACAPITRPSPFSLDARDPGGISVVVENNEFYDVTVYVESQGGRFRLGRVGGNTSAEFLPPREAIGASGAYHLVGVYSGRRRSVRTRPIEVVPGATTVWTLGASESLSAVVVR